jgi:hypothetical protein
MKSIVIENRTFRLQDIKRLYPAVLVKTGYGDEVTEMSLEWIDNEGKGKVEIAGYGIFILTKENKKEAFLYESRNELERAIGLLAQNLEKR